MICLLYAWYRPKRALAGTLHQAQRRVRGEDRIDLMAAALTSTTERSLRCAYEVNRAVCPALCRYGKLLHMHYAPTTGWPAQTFHLQAGRRNRSTSKSAAFGDDELCIFLAVSHRPEP